MSVIETLRAEHGDAGAGARGSGRASLRLAGLAACTAMTLHSYLSDRGWRLGCVHVDLRQVDAPAPGAHIEREILFSVPLTAEQRLLIADVVERTPLTRTLKASAEISTRISWREPAEAKRQTVARACALLRRRIDEAYGLPELAAEMGLTKSYLVRLFQKELRITPRQYRMLLQVSVACRLLAGGMPATDVAHAAGFCDQSHLTRWFKKVLGVTPGGYALHAQRREERAEGRSPQNL